MSGAGGQKTMMIPIHDLVDCAARTFQRCGRGGQELQEDACAADGGGASRQVSRNARQLALRDEYSRQCM